MNVEVRESTIAGAGRGLFALQDFKPGDAVLRLDRPYVAELNLDRLHDTCAWCFLRSAKDSQKRTSVARKTLPTGVVETKACTGCNKVRYCSKQCQARAWKREHRYECNAIKPENRPDLPEAVRAVIKLLGRLKADPEGKDEALLEILKFRPYTDEDVIRRFMDREPEKMEEWQTMAYAAWKYAGEPVLGDTNSLPIAKGFFFSVSPPIESYRDAANCCVQVMFNAISLGAHYNDEYLGIGFDPVLCSANHSCDPNVDQIFNQPETILRAVKPIKKGDEIFTRYIDVSNPRTIRQHELQNRYYFDCECPKCTKGPTDAADAFLKGPEKLGQPFLDVADGLVNRHADSLQLHLMSGEDETAMRRLAAIQAEAFSVSGLTQEQPNSKEASEPEIKDALKLCLNSGLWSYQRQPVPHLLKQLCKYYTETEQRYPAWRVGLKMYFIDKPGDSDLRFSAEHLVHVWNLACVTNTLCYPDMAHIRQECMEAGLDLMLVFVGLLLEIRDNLPTSFGMESPFGKLVNTVFRQAMESSQFSEEELKAQVKETWPKLEVVGKSVDILSL